MKTVYVIMKNDHPEAVACADAVELVLDDIQRQHPRLTWRRQASGRRVGEASGELATFLWTRKF
jgi:hypothetical protein